MDTQVRRVKRARRTQGEVWKKYFSDNPLALAAAVCYERGFLAFRGSSAVEQSAVNR